MKTNTKIRELVFIMAILIFFFGQLNAQSINIPDGAFITVKATNSLVVPGDINLGGGTSGILDMQGDLLKVSGALNLNSGSEFKIGNSTLNITSTVYNANSTVVYQGNNQTVLNHNYGNLTFNGTGIMQISGDAITPTTCNNFTVNNTGNSVNIAENKAININGTATNNAGNSGIIVASSNTGDGSLILATANIDGTVKRFCSGSQWHYISAPISNAQTSIFPAGYFLQWDASMLWTGAGDYSPWSSYASNELVVGQGYGYYSSNDVVSFEGKLNVGNYTQTLYKNSGGVSTNQGWNMIGNPYTSAIDWDVAVADGAVPVGAENAIYFFDDDNSSGTQSNYKYYVPSTGGTYGIGTEGANKNIPVGQGFFIKTNTDNVILNLKSSYRLHNTQAYYKNTPEGICNLGILGNGKEDQTIIRTVDNTTLDFDANYDARKLFTTNPDYPQIYSQSSEIQNDINASYIAINSISPIEERTVIPLGINAIEGNYTFLINELSIDADKIYFLDIQEDVKLNVDEYFYYEFYHEAGQNNNRFFLVFNNNTTEIDNQQAQISDISVFPNPTSGNVNISGIKINSQIIITDITGKIIQQTTSDSNMKIVDMQSFANGIYYLNIINNNESITKKIIKN